MSLNTLQLEFRFVFLENSFIIKVQITFFPSRTTSFSGEAFCRTSYINKYKKSHLESAQKRFALHENRDEGKLIFLALHVLENETRKVEQVSRKTFTDIKLFLKALKIFVKPHLVSRYVCQVNIHNF